jgi:pilus assembly protein CpaB
MNRRALLISLIAAMACVMLLFLYTRQFEQEMSGGDKIRMLVAVKPIERGKLVSDDMLGTRDVPIAYVENRGVKASERSKIIGISAANTVQTHDLLMWTDLAVNTEERDLSSLVQQGNRGVTVHAITGEETKGNDLIRPGDYVDVVATMPDVGKTAGTDGRSSVVLLQRVLVLAVGMATQAQAAVGNAQAANSQPLDMVLTLSLNLQEAQLLALATERGHLSVAVRNPDDTRVIEGIPDMSSAALFDVKARNDIQRKRPGTTPSAPIRLPTQLENASR